MIKLLELIDKNIKMVLKILYTHTHTQMETWKISPGPESSVSVFIGILYLLPWCGSDGHDLTESVLN